MAKDAVVPLTITHHANRILMISVQTIRVHATLPTTKRLVCRVVRPGQAAARHHRERGSRSGSDPGALGEPTISYHRFSNGHLSRRGVRAAVPGADRPDHAR